MFSKLTMKTPERRSDIAIVSLVETFKTFSTFADNFKYEFKCVFPLYAMIKIFITLWYI